MPAVWTAPERDTAVNSLPLRGPGTLGWPSRRPPRRPCGSHHVDSWQPPAVGHRNSGECQEGPTFGQADSTQPNRRGLSLNTRRAWPTTFCELIASDAAATEGVAGAAALPCGQRHQVEHSPTQSRRSRSCRSHRPCQPPIGLGRTCDTPTGAQDDRGVARLGGRDGERRRVQNPRRSVLVRRGSPAWGNRFSTRYSMPLASQ